MRVCKASGVAGGGAPVSGVRQRMLHAVGASLCPAVVACDVSAAAGEEPPSLERPAPKVPSEGRLHLEALGDAQDTAARRASGRARREALKTTLRELSESNMLVEHLEGLLRSAENRTHEFHTTDEVKDLMRRAADEANQSETKQRVRGEADATELLQEAVRKGIQEQFPLTQRNACQSAKVRGQVLKDELRLQAHRDVILAARRRRDGALQKLLAESPDILSKLLRKIQEDDSPAIRSVAAALGLAKQQSAALR